MRYARNLFYLQSKLQHFYDWTNITITIIVKMIIPACHLVPIYFALRNQCIVIFLQHKKKKKSRWPLASHKLNVSLASRIMLVRIMTLIRAVDRAKPIHLLVLFLINLWSFKLMSIIKQTNELEVWSRIVFFLFISYFFTWFNDQNNWCIKHLLTFSLNNFEKKSV